MKYHYNKETEIVGVCEAKISCPLGDAEHFATINEAENYATKQYETKYGSLPKKSKTEFTVPLTSKATELCNILVDNGVTPVVVGGSVRDSFFHGEPKDIDIEVYGDNNGKTFTVDDIENFFKGNRNFKTSEVGKSFNVLKVTAGEEDFDISLPRKEVSTGDGHRDYDLVPDSRMTFEDAALRRDFTINAMGYDVVNKKLIDPYNGRKDLQDNVLRHVSHNFSDDPLRVLRAVNFVSRFNSDVHPDTIELCRTLADSFKTLSKERIVEEFNKVLFKGDHIGKAFGVLYDTGWSEKMDGFRNFDREQLVGIGDTVAKVDRKFRKSILKREIGDEGMVPYVAETTNEIKFMNGVNNLLDSAADNSMSRAEKILSYRNLKKLDNSLEKIDVTKLVDDAGYGFDTAFIPERLNAPVVDGKKLIERGFKPGVEMGRLLKNALTVQDNENIEDFDTILNKAVRL